MTLPSLKLRSISETRRIRALLLKQERLALHHQGYVIRGTEQLSKAAWKAMIAKEVHWRIERRVTPRRPFNAGNNAARAADIAMHGEKSRWWFARYSESHSGDDKRGIKWWLRKWAREGKLSPAVHATISPSWSFTSQPTP